MLGFNFVEIVRCGCIGEKTHPVCPEGVLAGYGLVCQSSSLPCVLQLSVVQFNCLPFLHLRWTDSVSDLF